jgi:hypothetical protein
MKKISLTLLFFCYASILIHGQTRATRPIKKEYVKLEICDVVELGVVREKQTKIGDTIFREVSNEQLKQIEIQLKRQNICYWIQDEMGWGDFYPKGGKIIDMVYIFLVKDRSTSHIVNGNVVPIIRTTRRLVTGKLTDILGPPDME